MRLILITKEGRYHVKPNGTTLVREGATIFDSDEDARTIERAERLFGMRRAPLEDRFVVRVRAQGMYMRKDFGLGPLAAALVYDVQNGDDPIEVLNSAEAHFRSRCDLESLPSIDTYG